MAILPHAILLLLLTQSANGSRPIVGAVLDPSGAPVPGAHVRPEGSGADGAVVTGSDGRFALPAVADTSIQLVISAPGFAEQRVRVSRDPSGEVRVVLRPRGLTETIDVSADSDRSRVATPASATVLDNDAIAGAAALTIDDQLRSIPGFSLFRRSSSRVANPTTQGVTLRGLSASGASRTAVFADGIPLNDPFGGWVYWDRVPAAAIDRIEVTRGGSSDLYGSDALGGAIRIDTTRARAPRIWIDAGSDESARVSGSGGVTAGSFDVFGAGEVSTTDGYVIVAPESRGAIDVPAFSEYRSGVAGLGAEVTSTVRAEGRGSYFSEDRGNGTPFQTNATAVRQASASVNGAAWGGSWAIRAFGLSQDYDQTFSAIAADRASERPLTVQHVDTSSAGVNAEWLRAGMKYGFLVGGSYRQVQADLFEGAATPGAPLTLTAAQQRTAAATAQLSYQPLERWTIGAGIRAETWRSELRDSEGAETTGRLLPRASVAVRLNDDFSVRVAVHHAYRTPTINELYRPFRAGNVLTRANPLLGPEKSYGFEAAVFGRRGRTSARAVGFWTRLDDAVVNVTLESTPAAIVRQRQNAGRIRAAGMELEADVRLAAGWSATGSVAFIDSVFTEGAGLDGLRVPQVPKWQAAAAVHYVWSRATLSADWRFIDEQFDDDRNQFVLDRSSMCGARAGWRLREGLELFAAIENAFDQEQDVGRTPIRTIGLPRTTRIGFRWQK